jgi:hypothetical protein
MLQWQEKGSHGKNVLLVNAPLIILFSAKPLAGTSTTSGLPMPLHIRCPPGADCYRIWAS